MTYPDGRELNYDYGSAGATDDALSRVASFIDDDGTTHLVDYSYLGRNTFVQTDYPEPDLRYDLAMGAGDDPYDGFDRFGRIVDSRWYDYGSSADADRILYGYDRASNRTYREQTCDTNSYHDEVYGYDGVNRLTAFDRGTINGNKDAISTLKFAQEWSLDATGNWSGFKEDDDGDSTWDLEQSRTSNAVNEITDITETSGPAWATPVYNRAGNMSAIPKPADPAISFAATYDAWNRLVKLEDGEDTVSEYVYDAAKRRVVLKTYDSGELAETRHFYYTSRWQTIEERLESSGVISANRDRQFVWGLRYIDDLALRDRDTDSNASLDERLYALQDSNWNVTALAGTSGDVQERYAYSAYGTPNVLTSTFTTRASTSYDVEVLYAGYRYEQATRLYHVRHRAFHVFFGWLQRDPVGYADGMNQYSPYAVLNSTDPSGQAQLKGSNGDFVKSYCDAAGDGPHQGMALGNKCFCEVSKLAAALIEGSGYSSLLGDLGKIVADMCYCQDWLKCVGNCNHKYWSQQWKPGESRAPLSGSANMMAAAGVAVGVTGGSSPAKPQPTECWAGTLPLNLEKPDGTPVSGTFQTLCADPNAIECCYAMSACEKHSLVKCFEECKEHEAVHVPAPVPPPIGFPPRNINCRDILAALSSRGGYIYHFDYNYNAPLSTQIKQSQKLCCDDPFWLKSYPPLVKPGDILY
jgi:RHS repeat-associated protein